ncbi:MAG TPA: ATP-binding cassette domain-containing protein [Steroidobacteraceae bacterium]|nr:ATP-binding cassette domain-containing protein [Steroidobacteraceae bacterium]
MLNFNDLSIRRGKRVLFSGATFSLYRGEKIGITGENGSGKSSLLSLVRGEIQPEAGSFDMPSQLQLAHVSQELAASDRAALDFVVDGDAELRAIERQLHEAEQADDGLRLGELHGRYAAIGGYDARARGAQLLHGLGFTGADEERPVRAFSGGWRVRLNVAQALMCRSDLLLLDEPTNHLDLDAILWLEVWLRDYPGTLLLIAHDREFLDRVTDRIVNLEHGHAHAYRGNYSAFETQRASELAEQSALYARQQREIRHMESFVERFRAKASKARQAQSRLKALERMQRIAPAHVDSPFEFSFATPAKLPRPLLALEDQAAGYGGHRVIEGLNFTIAPGDRVALLGRNGAGKSTLMKLLAGELPALAGVRTEARDLKLGYFAQHQLEQLLLNQSPFQQLQELDETLRGGNGRAAEQDLRDFLAGFGFRGDRVFEPVEPFSGGEKARLVLALVAYRRPNLLLLDEPTNHLDLEMRQALSVALQDYEGAVVLVSHDRHLLRTVADEFRLVANGRAQPFDGDLEDYARWLGSNLPGAAAQAQAPASTPPPQPVARAAAAREQSADTRKQRKRAEARRRAALGPLRAKAAEYERQVEHLSVEAAKLERQLLQATESNDATRITLLARERARVASSMAAAEAGWMQASEELERAATAASP